MATTITNYCPDCGCFVERDDVTGEWWCSECEKVLREDELANESCQCPECGEPRPDDDRVANGMKCGLCAA